MILGIASAEHKTLGSRERLPSRAFLRLEKLDTGRTCETCVNSLPKLWKYETGSDKMTVYLLIKARHMVINRPHRSGRK